MGTEKETKARIENQIKPCPFCGESASYRQGDPVFYYEDYHTDISIECNVCSCEMTSGFGVNQGERTESTDAQNQLIKDWNKRAFLKRPSSR